MEGCAGTSCIHLVASLVKKMVDIGAIPQRWRGGEMVSVMKKASKPLTIVNSRGELPVPHIAKAYARAVG